MKAILSKHVGERFVEVIRTNLVDIAVRRYFERKRAGEAVRLEIKADNWQELSSLVKTPVYLIEVTPGKYLVEFDASRQAYLLTTDKPKAKRFVNYGEAEMLLQSFFMVVGYAPSAAIVGTYL